MTKRPGGFKSEATMCAEFIKHATADGKWIAYAETGGWDIVLVRKEDGFQIGVQAKLALNALVLDQSLPDRYWTMATNGPDCRAILVPDGKTGGLTRVCEFLGLTVIRVRCGEHQRYVQNRFDPALPLPGGEAYSDYQNRAWHEWAPLTRVKLPEYVPDVAAGSSAPVQLTDWKIKALKICIILESRSVTRADFKALGLDATRWTNLWLVKENGAYRAGPHMPNFKAQHPVNYEQIKADALTWMPAIERKEGVLL